MCYNKSTERNKLSGFNFTKERILKMKRLKRKRPFSVVVTQWLQYISIVLCVLFLTLCFIKCGIDKNSHTPDEDIIIEEPVVIPEEPEDLEETEESIEEGIEPAYDYTEEDLDLLARLIYSESGSETYNIKLMVGSVVVNRLDDPDFPDTLREVIYQKNQFSVTKIKINGVIMIDRPADEDSKKAAYEILNYGSILPQKVQVFYAKSVKSGWVTTREPYGTYGNTVFAYIYPKGEKQ